MITGGTLAGATSLVVANSDFNAGTWNSNSATKNPTAWEQSLNTAGNYGQTAPGTPNLTSIAAHLQDRNQNHYTKNLSADNAGLILSDNGEYTVTFDYGHRNDSAATTVGTFSLEVSLWDLNHDNQVGQLQTIAIESNDPVSPLTTVSLTVDVTDPSVDPYNDWVVSYALDPATDGAPGEDPDSDGLPNSEEYFLQSDPSINESGKPWQARPQKAQLMVISAHPDDEGIFFGGVIPYYTQVRQLPTVCVSMTSGDAGTRPPEVREAEFRNAVWAYGLRSQPLFPRFKDYPKTYGIDADQLPDTWETANFADLSSADPAADDDHDGLNNQYEFIAGLDPLQPDRIDMAITSSDSVDFSVPPATGPGYDGLTRHYRLEHSPDMIDWSDVVTENIADGTALSYPIPGGTSRGFYRMTLSIK